MNTIINLTQHRATPDQLSAGVVDLPPAQREHLAELLTFEECPGLEELKDRAREVADLALRVAEEHTPNRRLWDWPTVMIGGAPFFMSVLESELSSRRFIACYAFSRRESVDETLPDGTVKKTATFRHAGFVYV